jgi:hypothetical protein
MRKEQCEKVNCEYLHGDYCYDIIDNEGVGKPIPLSSIYGCSIADETEEATVTNYTSKKLP